MCNNKNHLLINASAGTGKTFSMATRFLKLMLQNKVKLHEIIALTFSRAAAAEIYDKLLERIYQAANDETKLASEKNIIGKQDLTRDVFRSLLRSVLDEQYQGNISTIDSFIYSLIRMFPLELGFMGNLEIIDDTIRDEYQQQAIDEFMNEAANDSTLKEYIIRANDGTFPRMLRDTVLSWMGLGEYGSFNTGDEWLKIVSKYPNIANSTPDTMRQALGIMPVNDFEQEPPRSNFDAIKHEFEAQGAKDNVLNDINAMHDIMRDYKGRKSPSDVFDKGVKKSIYEQIQANPAADEISFAFSRKNYTLPQDIVIPLKEDFARMQLLYLNNIIELSLAKIKIAQRITEIFQKHTIDAGYCTFNDLPRIAGNSDYEFKMLNIEYRLDAKINHWALDEFQDTSEEQWNCLKNLFNEAVSSNDKTTMTVGDRKQAIYGWRGGSNVPFAEVENMASGPNQDNWLKQNLTASFRYGLNTCKFINNVFGREKQYYANLPEAKSCQDAIEKWTHDWSTHQVPSPENNNDYVEVNGCEDFEQAILEKLNALWEKHQNVNSNETIAVLVRSNAEGKTIAETLRDNGLPAVFEGSNSPDDVPIVQAILQLIHLSCHPEDKYAFNFVKRSHLLETCFNADWSQIVTAQFVSEQLARYGLNRFLQQIVQTLSDDVTLDNLSKVRLKSLLKITADYDTPKFYKGIAGFADFVSKRFGRDLAADPSVIRILTIHRSKGLTIDRVLVPVNESKKSIWAPNGTVILCGNTGANSWSLPVNDKIAKINNVLDVAWKNACNENLAASFDTWYVALTRHRKALYVFLPAKCDEKHFSNLIDTFKGNGDDDNATPWHIGTEPEFTPGGNQAEENNAVWQHANQEKKYKRCTPSTIATSAVSTYGNAKKSNPFAENRLDARLKGTDLHAEFCKIDWINPTCPQNDLETQIMESPWKDAFLKTTNVIDLWREQSYELVMDDKWQTGQFDRVVFLKNGDLHQAVIYDFKTNAKHNNESDADFEKRMLEHYQEQMTAYRQALAKLTGIPLQNITAKLLLWATHSLITV